MPNVVAPQAPLTGTPLSSKRRRNRDLPDCSVMLCRAMAGVSWRTIGKEATGGSDG